MYIKRYEALDMQEALRLVKEDLGPEAVILSSRKVRKGKGTFGLLGRPIIEVTAAVDRDEGWGRGKEEEDATKRVPPKAREGQRQVAADLYFQREDNVSFSSRLREQETAWSPLAGELRQIKDLIHDLGSAHPSRNDPPPRSDSQEIKQELSELKEMVRYLLEEISQLGRRNLPPELLFLHQQLISQGIKHDLVSSLIERVLEQAKGQEERDGGLGGWRAGEGDDFSSAPPLLRSSAHLKATAALKQAIMEAISTAGPLKTEEGGPKVVALIGPTGVGKTTTVAKLAAHYALLKKRKVALVSMDTFRVAAAEQLKTYARLIGLPSQVVLSGKDLKGVLSSYRDKDLVLIDTAGRSQNAEEQMEELKNFFSTDLTVDFQLVVSATTKERDLWDVHQRFTAVSPISGLIFTKLDESRTFGGIFNQVVTSRLPLSYLTTGQRVPEDIEVATKERVAELILKGASALAASLPPS